MSGKLDVRIKSENEINNTKSTVIAMYELSVDMFIFFNHLQNLEV